ncbi:14986_t:CDS:1, partial [Racocetra persica]
LQLRQLIKNDYILKTTHQQEKGQLTTQFQQAKNNWEQEKKELQKARAQDLIDRLQKDLGINFLLDYQ